MWRSAPGPAAQPWLSPTGTMVPLWGAALLLRASSQVGGLAFSEK